MFGFLRCGPVEQGVFTCPWSSSPIPFGRASLPLTAACLPPPRPPAPFLPAVCTPPSISYSPVEEKMEPETGRNVKGKYRTEPPKLDCSYCWGIWDLCKKCFHFTGPLPCRSQSLVAITLNTVASHPCLSVSTFTLLNYSGVFKSWSLGS